jgi:hypothetical protein
MNDTSVSYGFCYEFNGRKYAFDVQADSQEEAEAKIRAIGDARFVTSLQVVGPEGFPSAEVSD